MAQKILVVDDESVAREKMNYFLEKAGYEVTQAVDGSDALSKLKEASFDLIVTDIFMPKVDGIEFFVELKDIDADVPVLGISGEIKNEEENYILDFGFTACLHKPVEEASFLEAVTKSIKS